MNQMVAITASNITVRYKLSGGSFRNPNIYRALDDISLKIYRGETLGIIGENGSGKTTLLKVIAGLLHPDEGYIDSHSLTIAMLAFGVGFDPNMTGRDNAMLGGMLHRHSKKTVKSEMEKIKEFSGLGDFFEQPMYTYSTGMTARLGFSVGILLSPDVLVIDEILGVGDAEFSRKAESIITSKIKSQESTSIIVSHSMDNIQSLCDRVILIEKGKVVCTGKPKEVIEEYQNRQH